MDVSSELPLPLPASAPPAPGAPATPAQPANTFVPPISEAEINGMFPTTVPLSLRTQFPDVDTGVITAIIAHDFKVVDLHKLDPTNCNKEMAYTFNSSTNQFEVSHQIAKEYKTPFAVLILLLTYFDILAFHIFSLVATGAFFRYTAHLLKLVVEYG
ncbi:hypothetical protein C0995_003455 [Termitomyces sp. Mi166|nr:hypothetical protein C0995_003455 [Termitomyces sp. Mi166\